VLASFFIHHPLKSYVLFSEVDCFVDKDIHVLPNHLSRDSLFVFHIVAQVEHSNSVHLDTVWFLENLKKNVKNERNFAFKGQTKPLSSLAIMAR